MDFDATAQIGSREHSKMVVLSSQFNLPQYHYDYVRRKIECPQTHKNDMAQHLAFWRIPLFFFIASDYWQRIDYLMLLSIVNDYEKITGKNSIMSACNLSYRLKRSGPKVSRDQFLYKFSESVEKSKGHSQLRPKQPP